MCRRVGLWVIRVTAKALPGDEKGERADDGGQEEATVTQGAREPRQAL